VPQKFRSKIRAAAIKEVEAFRQGNSADRDTNLLGGDIMLVVDPDLQANTTAYSLPFFVADWSKQRGRGFGSDNEAF